MTLRTSAATFESVRAHSALRNTALVICASLIIVVCARISVPLPFTPVPLTLANFAVLAVGLTLGSRKGFAAAALYLAQGAAGIPVFSPAGSGGIAQMFGPTGGFLLAYPVVAFFAGWLVERGARSFTQRALAAVAAEVVLFTSGAAWLMAITHASVKQAVFFSVYPFLFGEVAKVLLATGVAGRLRRAFDR
jgi:biotin transport system substrate-specific component